MRINKTHSRKKIVVLISLFIAVLVGGYFGVAALNRLPPFASVEKTYEPGEQVINLERSEAEKEAEKTLNDNPSQKTQNSQNDTPEVPTKSDSGRVQVNVLLTSAGIINGVVGASGFVTNIVEEGGVCTYTFMNGSSIVTKTTQTLVNPTSTTCTTASFPSSELEVGGTWKVTLSYESDAASGKSNTKEVIK